MIKLTDLKGADSVLPGKSPRVTWYKPDTIKEAQDIGYALGKNEAVASLETVSLVFDVEAMAKKLYEEGVDIGQTLIYAWEYCPNSLREKYRAIAQVISDNKNLFARLEKSK